MSGAKGTARVKQKQRNSTTTKTFRNKLIICRLIRAISDNQSDKSITACSKLSDINCCKQNRLTELTPKAPFDASSGIHINAQQRCPLHEEIILLPYLFSRFIMVPKQQFELKIQFISGDLWFRPIKWNGRRNSTITNQFISIVKYYAMELQGLFLNHFFYQCK